MAECPDNFSAEGSESWRRPEARLLAVLSLMPQTTALYETLPLALAAERKVEAAAFATLTMAAHLLYLLGPQGPWPVGAEYQWWVMLLLIYLPVLGLILSRPNHSGAATAGTVFVPLDIVGAFAMKCRTACG